MKRKFLLGGLVMFGLVAIISTTFAAFIIGNKDGMKAEADGGNITMGDVTSNIVKVEASLTDVNITFDAAEDDTEGDVTVSNYKGDYTATVEIKITGEEWSNVVITTVLVAEDTDKLIKLPEPITVNKADAGAAVEEVYTITKDLTFAWNDRFNVDGSGVNPSYWLDSASNTDYTTPQQKFDILEDWKTTIDGYKFKVNVVVNPAE